MGLESPEVSVLLAGDDTVRELNGKWRDQPETTDVLSFPLHTPDESPSVQQSHLGDVAINIEYAERLVETAEHRRRVADELDVDPDDLTWELEDEIEFLFIHALLHLLGHDHADPEEERQMKRKEIELFRASRQEGRRSAASEEPRHR